MVKARFITKLLWLIFLMMCLCGCSARWHYMKAKQKNPEMFEPKTDTVTVEPVGFTIDCDSLFDAVKNERSFDDYWTLSVATDVVSNETGEQKTDSVHVSLKPIYVYRYKKLTHADSLKVVFNTLTKEDSTRIFKRMLDVKVDCPDCENQTIYVDVPPSFKDKALYAIWGFFIIILIWMLLRLFTK